MNRDIATQAFVWAIILIVVVALPALLRRSRLRSYKRNLEDRCGRCDAPLEGQSPGYMEGFRICSRCSVSQRRSHRVAFAVLAVFGTMALIAVGLGAAQDLHRGQFGPWWVYLLAASSGPGLLLLALFVWRRSQAANRAAAARDAALAPRYDIGDEYQS